MTFWQENYHFIKDVYDMRHTKMLEWMENVEKAISRIMADKVYTSAEFKRERDNFHVSWWMHEISLKKINLSFLYCIFVKCTWPIQSQFNISFDFHNRQLTSIYLSIKKELLWLF